MYILYIHVTKSTEQKISTALIKLIAIFPVKKMKILHNESQF